MSKKRVGSLRCLNRFFNKTGINSDNKYSLNRRTAEASERNAKVLIKEKEGPDVIARNYESAAKYWLSAKEYEKAEEDFMKASKYWKEKSNQQDVVSKKFKGVSMGYSNKCLKNARRLKKVARGEWHGLEGKITLAVSFGGIIAGLYLLSPNITGNAVGIKETSNCMGAVLLIVGLVMGCFWLKSKCK